MNLFRLGGDLAHLVSIFILLQKITANKSAAGISIKTQILYSIVYVTRYIDVFTKWISLYTFVMKLIFIASSFYTVWLMHNTYKSTQNPQIDTFKIRYLIGGSIIMAAIFNHKLTFNELVWSFSIWLESVAILPQLFMLQRTGEAENITVHYIFALGIYRALYIPNWVYRWIFDQYFDYIATVAGIIQTLIYSDFFYVYYQRVMKGKKFELPQ
ncbi:ER lumen protein retaining receptor [Nadsonia fulvescens var. elongata DSM 6958]|uniref:ER lumen protein-retaining receptor n=1 Tax=Nadsonia fulvescens var. elongata DSM 6958 TaxID=857566 RepID=A0A1E3PT81_9ASCO|nr:ER lumen protein retaining receptor [Nadsonia fulvescens var. elongata DSM 6958]